MEARWRRGVLLVTRPIYRRFIAHFSLFRANAPRADRVDFNVRVGTVVPHRRIHVVPVPDTLVQIEPRWRGYEYFVYNNQVIVVSPRTMRIVAVLPAPVHAANEVFASIGTGELD